MTIIAAYATDEAVWMGSDSYSDNGRGVKSLTKCKVQRMELKPELLIGVCGISRISDVIDSIQISPVLFTPTPHEYILRTLPDVIREQCRKLGCLANDAGVEHLPDNELLFACQDKIYKMDSYFHLREIEGRFHAVGSGTAAALGAFYALEYNERMTPHQRVRAALVAAGKVDPYIAEPYHILATV